MDLKSKFKPGFAIEKRSKHKQPPEVVGNNSKGRISKWEVTRKQRMLNFPKNGHFLPPDTHTYVCVSGGKKCPFFGKFGVLCFLVTSVFEICLFSVLPTRCSIKKCS